MPGDKTNIRGVAQPHAVTREQPRICCHAGVTTADFLGTLLDNFTQRRLVGYHGHFLLQGRTNSVTGVYLLYQLLQRAFPIKHERNPPLYSSYQKFKDIPT